MVIIQFWLSPEQKCLLCSTRWQSRIRTGKKKKKKLGGLVVVEFWIWKYAILVLSAMENTDKYAGGFGKKCSVGVLYKLITSAL